MLLCSCFLAHGSAFCSAWAPDIGSRGSYNGVDLQIDGGYVFGKSHEIVYNAPLGSLDHDPLAHYKESELFWKIHNLWILGGKVQWNYLADRLHLFFKGWTKLTSSRTTMVDKDWSSIFQENPTDISWNRTVLAAAYKLLGELDYDFYAICFNPYDFKAGILMGYQFLNMRWNSYGGPFWYDNGADTGIHPLSQRRYSYQQQFSIPYLGVQLNWLQQKIWGVRTFGKYTVVASAKDQDFHIASALFFIDKFGHGHWWSAGAEIYWYFWKCLGLNFAYTYEQLNTTTGSSFTIPVLRGEEEEEVESYSYVAKGAGIFYSQQEFTLGLRGSF